MATEIRQGYADATGEGDFDVVWDQAFTNTSYTFVTDGFEPSGAPMELVLVSKSATKIVIRALVAGRIMALAKAIS